MVSAPYSFVEVASSQNIILRIAVQEVLAERQRVEQVLFPSYLQVLLSSVGRGRMAR